MRQFCLVMTALLGTAASAGAQVTVDLHALDALPGAKPAQAEPHGRRAQAKPPHRVATEKPQQPASGPDKGTVAPAPAVATTQPAAPPATTPASPAPPPATLPTAAPPTIALAPVAPPQPTEAAPPPPPISDSAATAATSTSTGLRVTFGAGQADLSPSSAAAIKQLVEAAPPGPNTSFNVVAYAAGTPEDPSTARRLSLSRALAVRSALMADGISSTRIFVRALGAASGDEPPDRVDLAVLGGNASAADAGAKSQAR
ncbi:MAG TPA: OmpA family protein [Acetobacteraceae bacterium]|jgi:outer membrane protein OmpA-like peptidoglycan-associated protein